MKREKLYNYFMGMGRIERNLFSIEVESTPEYLSLIARGHANPSVKLSRRIHTTSKKRVPLRELLPEVWGG